MSIPRCACGRPLPVPTMQDFEQLPERDREAILRAMTRRKVPAGGFEEVEDEQGRKLLYFVGPERG